MRTHMKAMLIAGMIGVLLFSPSLVAQTCLGVGGARASVAFGIAGTDGASGASTSFTIHADRMSVSVRRSSLEKFAQDDEIVSSALGVAWVLSDGPVQLCGLASLEWTSYEAGNTSNAWWMQGDAVRHREYQILGDFARGRIPIGVGVGREFGLGRHIAVNPFLAVVVSYDYERMRWVPDYLETRSRIGPGAALGFTVRAGPLFFRSQLGKVWTADRALSGHHDSVMLQGHLGWAF